MSNITDKVVISSGIGESTAKLLAQQVAKIVLGARRSNRIDDHPKADVHVLDAGHFALDTKTDEIAALVDQ